MSDRKIQLPKTPAKSLMDGTLSARDYLQIWRLGSFVMEEVCRRAAKGDKSAREIVMLAESRLRTATIKDMLDWGEQ